MAKNNLSKEKPLLLLFKENELNISNLYALYAKKIPEKEEFWKKLSEEEISHAAYINENSAGDYINSITKIKFSDDIVNYLMDFVLKEIEKTEKKSVFHRNAVLTALRIERSMLEERYFDIFTPKDTLIKKIFKNLTQETKRHIDILEKELTKVSNAKK
jgi:bacterioferritin (cytochrome b1)